MIETAFPIVERNIARCRVALSVGALVAVFIDPTQLLTSRWVLLRSGTFEFGPYVLAVIGAHLCYSVALIYLLTHHILPSTRVASITTSVDVLFGVAIAMLTEGVTSLFYPFFVFAGFETGFRSGVRW